jgi:excisionase family DNA binding protein
MVDTSRLVSLDTKEAAPLMGTTPSKVRQMLNKGVLHGYKIGTGPKSQWRVTVAELERFMGREAANA